MNKYDGNTGRFIRMPEPELPRARHAAHAPLMGTPPPRRPEGRPEGAPAGERPPRRPPGEAGGELPQGRLGREEPAAGEGRRAGWADIRPAIVAGGAALPIAAGLAGDGGPSADADTLSHVPRERGPGAADNNGGHAVPVRLHTQPSPPASSR